MLCEGVVQDTRLMVLAVGNTDLFFGGLAPITSFNDVEKAISPVADEILRVQFRQECGYGVIRFSSAEAAGDACQLLTQVNIC